MYYTLDGSSGGSSCDKLFLLSGLISKNENGRFKAKVKRIITYFPRMDKDKPENERKYPLK